MQPTVTGPLADLQAALRHRGIPGPPWYTVLDAAQRPSPLDAARAAGVGTVCLYTGEFGRQVEHAAPHLAPFDPAGALTPWLHRHWDSAPGILLQTAAPFEELRRHLKRFLLAKTPEGKTVRLRFYDPRVLSVFLPVCNPAELKDFFGPVAAFYTPGRGGPSVVAYSLQGGRLSIRHQRFRPPPVEPPPPAPKSSDLEVFVLDAARGVPIEGASVLVEGAQRWTEVSGPGGRTLFTGLPPGPYSVFGIDKGLRHGRTAVELAAEPASVRLLCRG